MNCAYCRESDLVGDVMFSLDGALHTHQSLLELSRNIGILQSSLGGIIPISQPPAYKKKNVPTLFANFFLGSVATQLR